MTLPGFSNRKSVLLIVCFLAVSLTVTGQEKGYNNQKSLEHAKKHPDNEGHSDGTPENLTEPIIALKSNHYNFQSVSSGKQVQHTFHFKNAGEKPLKVTGVEKSCDCIDIEYPRRAVKSGKVHKIKVTLDTESLEGEQEHTIKLINNGLREEMKLTLSGKVLRD